MCVRGKKLHLLHQLQLARRLGCNISPKHHLLAQHPNLKCQETKDVATTIALLSYPEIPDLTSVAGTVHSNCLFST